MKRYAYSTKLIHNLGADIYIPPHVIRILNLTFKYNFDSIFNYHSLLNDFNSFRHRFICNFLYRMTPRNADPTQTFNQRLWVPSRDKLTQTNNLSVNSYLHNVEYNLKEAIDPRFLLQTPLNNDRYTLQQWFINNDIIIKPTDKNLGIAIIPIGEYVRNCFLLLNDRSTYRKAVAFSPNRIAEEIRTHLTLLANIFNTSPNSSDKQIANFLKNDITKDHELPYFHIIPKIHKTPWVGRPIVSNVKGSLRNLAIVINEILDPFTRNHVSTIIKDSKELIQLLDGSFVDPEDNFFSLDIIGMYTNIPLVDTMVILRKCSRIPKLYLDALQICFDYNFFQFNSEVYQQIDGIPMGINFAVAFANLAFYYLVELNPILLPYRKNISFWARYIDDLNGIWHGSNVEFKRFFESINQCHPKIQFTVGDYNKSAVFLDVVGTINPQGDISFALYQKKLNKYLYIPFSSTHTFATKSGWIKGELIRLCRNCSNEIIFNKNVFLFTNRLMLRGYPMAFIQRIMNNFHYNTRNTLLALDPCPAFRNIEWNQIHNMVINEMITFFDSMRIEAYDRQSQHFGIKQASITISQPIFATHYSTTVKRLDIMDYIHKVPLLINRHPTKCSPTPKLVFKINNKLGTIFSHKEHDIKIREYLERNDDTTDCN